MPYTNYLTPGKMTSALIVGLIAGTITFKVVPANALKDVIKDFPTNRAIAATGLVCVILYAVWAKREDKKEELESVTREELQSTLDLLKQLEKKKSKKST